MGNTVSVICPYCDHVQSGPQSWYPSGEDPSGFQSCEKINCGWFYVKVDGEYVIGSTLEEIKETEGLECDYGMA